VISITLVLRPALALGFLEMKKPGKPAAIGLWSRGLVQRKPKKNKLFLIIIMLMVVLLYFIAF
jgi:hypothetical protein